MSSGVALVKPQYLFRKSSCESDESTSTNVRTESKVVVAENHSNRRGLNKNRYQENKVKYNKCDQLCQCLQDVPESSDFPTCKISNCNKKHDVAEFVKNVPTGLPDCPVYKVKGYCSRGLNCLFARSHITADGKNKICLTVKETFENNNKDKSLNYITPLLQQNLRKKRYNFDKANHSVDTILKRSKVENNEEKSTEIGYSEEILNSRERRKISWNGKLYLSPLTTLGNLPFRRVCKLWGADITCGEMAMAQQLLQATTQEWALLRRHSTEDLFGVQICGNNPHLIARCVQLIEENIEVDFIDLNLGCPIELVYQKGGGSGLLRRQKVLSSVVQSIAEATTLPFTIKTRTGVYGDKLIADTLMPLFSLSGASLITVHGRTREQRYVRSADWDYIEKCAKSAAPTPVFGNGDILSYHDYYRQLEKHPTIAGAMIGRGALYKPWIFTEIKERRDWDISSRERFDILKDFVKFGLDHWGTDFSGVCNTRRFLLEWLSFLHRYIPVGILEVLPQRMNERPPRYVGRDDLETLMASPNCSDWVKISEMLLGPAPEGFKFLPKHKASSWSSE